MPETPSIPYNASVRIATSSELRPAINDTWQARRELAEVLRRLNGASLTANPSPELLRSVAAALAREAGRLEAAEPLVGHQAQAEHIAASQGQMPDLLYEMSPAIGQSNALAPPMRMWQEDGCIHALATPGWAYEGPFGYLHGGVIALLFDQLLGAGQRISGTGGRTGTLATRYLRPTPVNTPLRLVARIDRIEGRKKFLIGELWDGEVMTASCEGIFIADRNQPQDEVAAGGGAD